MKGLSQLKISYQRKPIYNTNRLFFSQNALLISPCLYDIINMSTEEMLCKADRRKNETAYR